MSDLQEKKETILPTVSQAQISVVKSEEVFVDPDFVSTDFSYGWLRISAANSEAVQPGDKQIKGLVAGQFFNTMTQKIYQETVKVIPLKFFWSYAEYKPGTTLEFVRAITPDHWRSMNLVRSQKGSGYDLPNGNIGKEQMNYMVVLPDDEEAGIVRLGLGPGSFGSAKAWNYLFTTKRCPKHEQIWELKVVYNPPAEKGQSAFYSLGRGTSFSGRYIDRVEESERPAIWDMVQALRENENRLHESQSGAVQTTADEPVDRSKAFNEGGTKDLDLGPQVF